VEYLKKKVGGEKSEGMMELFLLLLLLLPFP